MKRRQVEAEPRLDTVVLVDNSLVLQFKHCVGHVVRVAVLNVRDRLFNLVDLALISLAAQVLHQRLFELGFGHLLKRILANFVQFGDFLAVLAVVVENTQHLHVVVVVHNCESVRIVAVQIDGLHLLMLLVRHLRQVYRAFLAQLQLIVSVILNERIL